MMATPIVVLDNGASSLKFGVASQSKTPPRIITNAIVRSREDKTTYIGVELENCKNFASLHYRLPFEKGYLVDWDAQKAIWDPLFNVDYMGAEPSSCSLLITEPYFNFPNLQEVYDQFVFEEYEFQSYLRCTPASTIPYGSLFDQPRSPPPECCIIVDCGFSFPHVVPMIKGEIVWDAVKRIDVGGKLLTNQLKELVSFRQWNMMDETHIINDVKESSCFVSQNYAADLEICRANPRNNSIVKEYILPDYSVNRPGHIRQPDEPLDSSYQILYMNNERFSIPEILFRPDDVGLDQCGIPETIAHSISLLPEDIQGMFWANIGLIGGSTKFAGFRDRLFKDLTSLAPSGTGVSIWQSEEPILEAYHAAMTFSLRSDFQEHTVTRAEYLEMGSNACRRKWKDWKPADCSVLKTARETLKSKNVERESSSESSERDSDEVEDSGRASTAVSVPKKRGRPRGRGHKAGMGTSRGK
ncbi:actin-like protein Arp6 [Abortiporus biennis]|nr:actin-like protein Arp6 [Abortiporus biennis]